MSNQPLLVAFEGIDGAGKTVLSREVAAQLGPARCVWTSEPHRKDEVRAAIREGRSAVDVYTSDRAEHFRAVIAPAMLGGKIVLCDRYYWSTLVYQGDSLSAQEWIAERARQQGRHVAPDLWCLVDTPHEVAAKRVADRGEEITPAIKMRLGVWRETYLHHDAPTLGRIITLDGTMSVQHNVARVLIEIGRLLR